MTSDFRELWAFAEGLDKGWAKKDKRLSNSVFKSIGHSWDSSIITLSDYSRRQMLIELDVLVAMKLKLSLSELLSIFRTQFSILRQNEADTWYDGRGSVVFTSSQSISGVGLDRKYNKKSGFSVSISNGVFVDGSERFIKLRAGSKVNPWSEENGQIGWEDIKDLKSGIVTKTYMDDTVPDGPIERTIEYHAPFDRCDREEDYRVVWAEFERRFGNGS
jgi:hypothetical protein